MTNFVWWQTNGKSNAEQPNDNYRTMNAEIIVIGDELLIGQVTDTNSGMLARELNTIGISVLRTTAVHDDAEQISQALHEAFSRVPLVLMTGGLGPTKDDITKQTLCDFFHTRLVPSVGVERHVRALYSDRPDVLNRLTATQWLVPEACNVLENRVGSAPLMEFEKEGRVLYSMPGVPYEAQVAMEEQIMPRLRQRFTKGEIRHRTVIVYGIPESALAIRIAAWEDGLPAYMHLAYLPADRMIRLRLTGMNPPEDVCLETEMEQRIKTLRPLIQDFIVAEADKPVEVLVGERLLARGQTVGSAESCTGGRVAALLNKQAGSSAFYMGSVVAYDNSVKERLLNVSAQTLLTDGAVSEATVRQMAEGARRMLRTDYAVATSGIAGPGGATPDKPVGTVWMAVATPETTVAQCLHFRGGREQVTRQASVAVLLMLLRQLD